jgi:hypothetical protein
MKGPILLVALTVVVAAGAMSVAAGTTPTGESANALGMQPTRSPWGSKVQPVGL